MILSDRSIKEALQAGRISVEPAVAEIDIRPVGIRVHLAPTILVPVGRTVVNLQRDQRLDFEEREVSSPYLLERGAFVLGSTNERIRVHPELTCQIDGRSTLARLGIMVHCSSSTFDNIHDEARSATLEIANIGPHDVLIHSGLPIAMLMFVKLTSAIEQPSQAQYRGQSGALAPQLSFKIGENRGD